MKLSGIILIMVFSLTSCVGIGVMGGKKEEHSSFGINETRSKPMRRVTDAEGGRNPTRKEIQSSWGEPNQKCEEGGEELWCFDSGLAIRGAVPMLGIGIPLVIPIGKNSYDFHFPAGADRASRLVVNENQMRGGYLGVSAFSETKKLGFHKFED